MNQQNIIKSTASSDIEGTIVYEDGFFYIKDITNSASESVVNKEVLESKRFYSLNAATEFMDLMKFVNEKEDPQWIVMFTQDIQAFYLTLNNHFTAWITSYYSRDGIILVSQKKTEEHLIFSYTFKTLSNPDTELLSCDVRFPLKKVCFLNRN